MLYFCRVENLSQHIEKLLARHDYVVVPGLGGFVIQPQSAVIQNDLILPPCAIIGFNPLMLHSDGLLAIEVSRVEEISYRQAMNSIQKMSESIKSKLLANESVQIGNLGTLCYNDSRNIIFTPEKIPEFLPQNFGLTELYLSPGLETTKKQKEIRITISTGRFYKYAAIGLLLIGLFLTTTRVSDVRQSDYATLAPALFENSTETKVEETKQAEESTNETFTEKVEPEVVRNFHVVVASLPSKSSADNFCKVLIEADFKNAHVLEPVRTYRIAIESFSDKNEAIQYMENLRKTDKRFETAWVLCK